MRTQLLHYSDFFFREMDWWIGTMLYLCLLLLTLLPISYLHSKMLFNSAFADTLSQVNTANSLTLTTHHSPLTAHQSPLTTHRPPLTTHHSPLTTHHSPVNLHPHPHPHLNTLPQVNDRRQLMGELYTLFTIRASSFYQLAVLGLKRVITCLAARPCGQLL